MTCYDPYLLHSSQGKGRQLRCPLASECRCLQGKLGLCSYPCARWQAGQAGPEGTQSTHIRPFLWIAVCPPKSLCLSACWYTWALEITGTKARMPEGEKCLWAPTASSLLPAPWGDSVKAWPLFTTLDLPVQSKYCPLIPWARRRNPGRAEGIVCPTLVSHMMVWWKFWLSRCSFQEVHAEMMLKEFLMHLALPMGYDGQGNMRWCGLKSIYSIL